MERRIDNKTPVAACLTASAAKRIKTVAARSNNKGKMLRVSVSGGGCKGFSYHFAFDDKTKADDRVFKSHGAVLVVDKTSLGLLTGSEIDFVEEVMGARFEVRNPNAESSCGCGMSFDL